ncbi:hypothetical protein PYW07_008430 [Mythimna separata]|uniref:MD-2-related lipid-recognition domain-containing protein n=1 Tax=Mythimna separata TaxID=271217 RepID=A0AAD7YD22_MYTSE|nr:hypothetical protein PYW07_008430 [Mythimna separata]
MLRAVVLLCAILALTEGRTTQFSQCTGSFSGLLPINAYLAGCDLPPCVLPQGQDALVNIVFRAPHNILSMRTVAMAYLSFIPIPYDLGEKAITCNYLANTYCPLVRDEVVMYTLNMPIEEFMPVGTQLPVEFRVMDDNNRAIMCIRAVVRVAPPVATHQGTLAAGNATMTV